MIKRIRYDDFSSDEECIADIPDGRLGPSLLMEASAWVCRKRKVGRQGGVVLLTPSHFMQTT